jgi:hypothetical protein
MGKYTWLPWVQSLLVAVIMISGTYQVQGSEVHPEFDPKSKITFDLGQLTADGLYGPPNGLRALHYEFCIPAEPTCEAQVKSIDPTIVIAAGSKGRVGCTQGEYLCIGSTHQPEIKAVLLKLASLPYIKQIKQCFFE